MDGQDPNGPLPRWRMAQNGLRGFRLIGGVKYKIHMSLKIRTKTHARKMKVISSGITFMGIIQSRKCATGFGLLDKL